MKTILQLFCITCLCIFATISCITPKSDLPKEIVQEHLDNMINGYVEEDIDQIIAGFTEDAQMLEDGGPIVNGKSEIIQSTKALLENIEFTKGSAEIIEIQADMNMAYEVSYFRLTQFVNDSTSVDLKWKHLAIWQKQNDGEWKISRLIYNEVE
ncbi:YybH family protein [Chondrinema litorale]|uniref:YybH family protein n=1 Tax=Chondrinema litorale TaxID=2994555 RepID=UPI0025430501|nr:nuclear transport factor 2 family protein [Chondrinema litorale]UZR99734.1 nuclear transport factor 2 family protein [Chondrinema litorale]